MKIPAALDRYRIVTGQYASVKGQPFGAFKVPGPARELLAIIADDGRDPEAGQLGGWEHVSVSCRKRTPTWEEMCWVKDQFWDENECVMQLHPPRSEYVNNHPYCLHLWRPINERIPMPPSLLVGYKGLIIDRSGGLR